MLRGLDARGADEDPIVVKVADRPTLEGTTTVYLRTGVSSVVRDRQARVRETFDQLRNAGVLGDVDVVEWPERARTPADTDVEAEAVARYDDFVDAVGAGALEPFFEERADGSALEVPAVCIAIRDDGGLTGLYPRHDGDTEQTVGDCIRALAAGDRVENVA